MGNVQKTYALVIGVVALLVGILGLLPAYSTLILGIFGVNLLQTLVHLLTGVTGIYAGTKGDARTFNPVLGWAALILGIGAFIPGISGLLVNLLNVNTSVNVLHLLVGLITLGVVYWAK